MIYKIVSCLIVISSLSVSQGVSAWSNDLNVGYDVTNLVLDPHTTNTDANLQLTAHVFSKLIRRDNDFKIENDLAQVFKQISDTDWYVELRPNAFFSDHTPVTSDDVKCTIDRIKRLKRGVYANVSMLTDLVKINDRSFILKTATVYPLLPNSLALVQILSCHQPGIELDANLPADQLIGSGPYKVASFSPTTELSLERNPNHFGRPSFWKTVTFHVITDAETRYQALLKGDVDLIVSAPTVHLSDITADARFEKAQRDSYSTLLFTLDQYRDGVSTGQSLQYLTLKSGGPLPGNPLKLLKFRRALSLALDRQGIVAAGMFGAGSPGKFIAPIVTEGVVDSDLNPVPTQDLAMANQLLNEAAAEDPKWSFLAQRDLKIVFQVSTARTAMAQVIASNWRQLGFTVDFQALPAATMLSRGGAPNYEFQIMLPSWGADSGELSSSLKALLATVGAQPGWGGSNRGRYSNSAIDVLLGKALLEMDTTTRTQLLHQGTDLAMQDQAVLPVAYLKNTWYFKKSLCFEPRVENHFYAFLTKPENIFGKCN